MSGCEYLYKKLRFLTLMTQKLLNSYRNTCTYSRLWSCVKHYFTKATCYNVL